MHRVACYSVYRYIALSDTYYGQYDMFFRYHASVVKSTISDSISPKNVVPGLPQLPKETTTDHDHQLAVDTDDINLVELDPKKQQLEDLGPSLLELKDVDPSLVFLCYRGFNHISGKVQNGRTAKVY